MITTFDTEDLMAPEVVADPYGYYGELRESDPVHWNPMWKMWIVTRYDDVVRLIREPELFSSETPLLPEPHELVPPIHETDWEFVDEFKNTFRTMVRSDRPRHLEMRQVVHRWFTPRAVERWREELRAKARKLIEERLPDGGMEARGEFAVWPPLTTISLMLGIPISDVAHLRDLSVAFGEIEKTEPDRMRRAVTALNEMYAYFEPLIEARSGAGAGEDLITLLAEGERNGVFTRQEAVANAVLIFLAGHDTTMSLISNGIANLIRNPEQWDLLRSDPAGLCASATEECLRYEPSIKVSERICAEDVELGDKEIAAGEMILWVIAAANRDPRVFSDPDSFDITRSPNRHIGFGGGIHHCLGAALSRVEAQEMFRALVELLPRPRLVDEEIEYEEHLTFRTPKTLQIRWG